MVTRGVLDSEALSRDGLRVTGYGIIHGTHADLRAPCTPACVRLPDPIEAQPAARSF
jgi:hypothetical protein